MTDHIEPTTQAPELPPEVFAELLEDARRATKDRPASVTTIELARLTYAAGAKAGAKDEYQRGADAELEAICEWLEREGRYSGVAIDLRTARRPKSPSKVQALEAFEELIHNGIKDSDIATIRRALESLMPKQKPPGRAVAEGSCNAQ
jgi:hypothetical protein